MDRDEIRRAWDGIAETSARRRDPTGSDAALLDEATDSTNSRPSRPSSTP